MAPHPHLSVGIVGGGLIGLACAADLAAAGCRVTLYDGAPEAREASWAAAGMLAPHHECDADNPLWRLGREGLDDFPRFLADHGIGTAAVDYRRSGSWIPVLDAEDQAEVEKRAAFLTATDVLHRLVTAAELRRMEPGLSPEIRAALTVDGGQVNPRLLADHLRGRCATLGVELRYRTRVTRLAEGLVTHEQGEDRFTQVVLASGAWTPALAAATGLDLAGEPVKGQLLRLAAADDALGRFIHSRHAYLVPRRGEGLVVGASMVWSGFDRSEDEAVIAELAAKARHLLPGLANAPVVETWTGLRPRLRSGLPCITRADDHLVIATGHFRNGILLTPITAACVKALVLDEEPPVDLTAFNLPGRS